MMSEKEELCEYIGIDLGTSNCCVAGYPPHKDGMEVFRDRQNETLTPSWIAFTNEKRLYGRDAVRQQRQNRENTIYDVKRVIGRKFDDETSKADRANWPFEIIQSTDTGLMKYRVMNEGKMEEFTCEQLSGLLLRHLGTVAFWNTKRKAKKAVITVPAHFGEAQRRATGDAGEIGGFKVIRILNEPTAAAIAYYGLDHKILGDDLVLVYDLGGGTFDVSILKTENEGEGFTLLEVKATGGNSHLGGRDFDLKIAEHIAEKFQRESGKDVKRSPGAWNKIVMESEQIKINLSKAKNYEAIFNDLMDGKNLSMVITRSQFEYLIKEQLNQTMDIVKSTIKDAKIKPAQIRHLLLVGGSTRIPKVVTMIEEMFPSAVINNRIDPDEVIARGAALLAKELSGFGDETVTLGLADVTPLSLGVRLVGDEMDVMIPRNSTIPTKSTAGFTTTRKNQSTIFVKVYEGERPNVKDNNFLGELNVPVPPKAKGVEKVDVTFILDENCMLTVKTKAKSTGREKTITIERNQMNLNPEEILHMQREAKEYSQQDKEWKINNDAKVRLAGLINDAKESARYSYDKKLKDLCAELDEFVNQKRTKNRSAYDEKYTQLKRAM